MDWNGQRVGWTEIVEIQIHYHEVEGNNSYNLIGFGHTISDGINMIQLELTDGTKLEGWYGIGSEYKQASLKDLLRKAVLKHKLPYSIAVAVLKPKNYKAHQELKKELAAQGAD